MCTRPTGTPPAGWRFRSSTRYWDAATRAAAEHAGGETFETKDHNDGQDYAGVRVVNPFTPR